MTDRVYHKRRVHRPRTSPHRWGDGVVHLVLWTGDAWWDAWRLACRPWARGEEITDRGDPTPVTRKRCLGSELVPPDWRPTDTSVGDRRTRAVSESKEKEMALRGASTVTVDQDWVDFKELAKENTAVLLTVNRIEDLEKFTNDEFCPVRARVIVLTGKRAGEVFPDERILAAGIRGKLIKAGVGADVVGRIRPYGQRKNAGLEDEEPGDIKLAEAALAKHMSNGSVTTSTKSAEASDDPPF